MDNFNWLDDLAGANKMKLFLPLQETEVGFEQEATETAVAPKKEKRLNDGYKNCSLRIAGEFNLTANQLPAFLFFTLKEGQACVEHCAWLQFKPQAFAGEASEGQELLSDLFSAVTIARRKKTSDELVVKLKVEIDRIRLSEQMRPLKRWAMRLVVELSDIPADFVRNLLTTGLKKAAGAG